MCDGRALVYLYDGSFEGLLTTIYEAYYKEPPSRILTAGQYQQAFDERYEHVQTDLLKSDRVYDAIEKKIGKRALSMVYYGWLSHEPERAGWIYEFVKKGFKFGRGVTARLTDQDVERIHSMNRPVLREYDKQRGFLRFSALEGGLYYARIETISYQLPLLTPFFFERMNTNPFIIHDKRRNFAGVSDTREWRILNADGFTAPNLAKDEEDYRRWWRGFHEVLAIESRKNLKLQSQNMPKRYWTYITEMNKEM